MASTRPSRVSVLIEKPKRGHDDERGNDRHRNRHRRNQRGAQVAEEQVDHGDHERHRDQPSAATTSVIDALDEDRTVEVDARAACPAAGRGGCARSSSRARPCATSSVFAFEICSMPMLMPGTPLVRDNRALVLGGEPHVGHLVESHEITVGTAADDELAEFLLGVEAGFRSQRQFALRRFEPACRQLHVLAAQRRLDVGDGELSRRQRLAVDPDAHRIAARAAHAHACHAGQHAEAVDQFALGVVGEFEHVHRVARQREPDDGSAPKSTLPTSGGSASGGRLARPRVPRDRARRWRLRRPRGPGRIRY